MIRRYKVPHSGASAAEFHRLPYVEVCDKVEKSTGFHSRL
jgi:hypothetical protein